MVFMMAAVAAVITMPIATVFVIHVVVCIGIMASVLLMIVVKMHLFAVALFRRSCRMMMVMMSRSMGHVAGMTFVMVILKFSHFNPPSSLPSPYPL